MIKNNSTPTNRRAFLSKLWKILGIVALAELALFIYNLLQPAKKNSDAANPALIKTAGNVSDFALNSVTADRINKYYLIRYEDGGFLALSLTCSHLGCSVNWEETKKEFICPCHSSSFDKQGDVVNAPAPRPLDYYRVIIEAGKVKIDLSTKIRRRKFEKSQMTYAI
jgi:cytochrome b6-f complex iron-sulfur subunit